MCVLIAVETSHNKNNTSLQCFSRTHDNSSALYVTTVLLVSVRPLMMMSFEVQTTAVATQEHSFHLVCISSALVRPVIMYLKWQYISITIVQGYTGQYHHFIAVGCLVTSAQYE